MENEIDFIFNECFILNSKLYSLLQKKNIVKIKIQIICNARRIKNQLKPTNIFFKYGCFLLR